MDVPVKEVSSDYSDDSPNERTTTPPTQIEPKCSNWSNWRKWSQGSATCETSYKQRMRSCKCGYLVRPATKCGGGISIESRPVSLMSCYSWTIWGAWSSTSQTCGDACRDRYRSCKCGRATTSPRGECKNGISIEKQKVKLKPCCDWTNWGAWSSLSVTCGSGYISRSRQCSGSNGNNLNRRLIKSNNSF